MRFILPHSSVKYDLAEAQEEMDCLVAFQRFTGKDFLDALDITVPYYHFTLPFACSFDNIAPAHFRVRLPFPFTVERVYFWSAWGAAPGGSIGVSVYANYKGGDSATWTADLTSGAPLGDSGAVSVNQNSGENLHAYGYQGAGGAPVSLNAWGVVLSCRGLVEVV